MRNRVSDDRRGQAILEYAILISAVALGVAAMAGLYSKRFAEHAQRVEQNLSAF